MSDARSAAPLWVWAITLALVLPLPAPFFIPSLIGDPAGVLGPNEFRYRHELGEFLKTAPRDRARPTGVMLTMSGGSCATVGPRRLASHGADMFVAYYSAASLNDYSGLIDVLVRAQPDFVVIQDTVLTQPARPLWFPYSQVRAYWRSRIYQLAGRPSAREADQALRNRWRCGTFLRPPRSWVYTPDRIKPYSEHQRRNVAEFLTQFSKAKIPILIASPPANETTAEYRYKIFQVASALIAQDNTIPGVSLHRQSGLTPRRQFHDPIHLSPGASHTYRTWLNGEIMRIVEKQANERPR